jgi:hypothetical protein
VLLDAIAAAAGTRSAVSNGWRYGAQLREQAVPKNCGNKRQKIEIDAMGSLQQLFARGGQVRGRLRGSVVAALEPLVAQPTPRAARHCFCPARQEPRNRAAGAAGTRWRIRT